ncbi:MAG: fimbrillin family protein [Bacteroides sp.]|nr:fimbrillin family protein [Bacteroides sp.]
MRKIRHQILFLLWTAFGLASCSGEFAVTGDAPSLQGGLLSVGFEDAALTRGASGVSVLAQGMVFKVYAYNQGTVVGNSTAPLAEGDYLVKQDAGGKQTIEAVSGKDLKLYAGTYDLYFVSYNSDTDVPSVGANSSVISGLKNEQDFLYTYMKDVGIRSVEAGDTRCLVTLDKPFSRKCSALRISVKARTAEEGGHPVQPLSLEVVKVNVSGLSNERSFLLGKDVLEASTGYTGKLTFEKDKGGNSVFSNNTETDVTLARTSSDRPVLPTDGSVELSMEIVLHISYANPDTPGSTLQNDYTYKVVSTKALLAGTCYEFAFKLTFFDSYLPANLQMDVIPYVNAPLNTGHVGG